MKTQLITVILLTFLSGFGYAQSKAELGITAEGNWFRPYQGQDYYSRDRALKNGLGTGIGVYASRDIWWRLSADLGLAYRYKQMQQHYVIYGDGGGQYGGEPDLAGWDKLPMHYLVIPLHCQLLLTKNFFIRGGLETAWLLNYDAVNQKPEYSWTIGFGSQKHKLKWSLNYITGFKNQSFGYGGLSEEGWYNGGSSFYSETLQLSFSYPIWQK
ncbi:MAG: hypothetical protein ACK5JD_13355 [Mangrovibacterium sp.]